MITRRQLLGSLAAAAAAPPRPRPNILLLLADNWAQHASAYGDPVVRTPVFDQLAKEGVLFTHAYAPYPSCSPSRSGLLTGRPSHALGGAASLCGPLAPEYTVYPDLLEKAGYAVGYSGKGWGPGKPTGAGRTRNPAGNRFDSLADFLAHTDAEKPFCFWFGSNDPHTPWDRGRERKHLLDPAKVALPPHLPDHPTMRDDILNYYCEVQQFDADCGELLELLRRRNALENTLVVMTSDNGWQMPRGMGQCYDLGVRIPMVVRWPERIRGGRRSDAFVKLDDLFPTFLETVGLPVPKVPAASLWPLLEGRAQAGRDEVFVERERHASVRRGNLGYPTRGVHTRDYIYLRNLAPNRWPAGDPDLYWHQGPYGDVEDLPSKRLLLDKRSEFQRTFELVFGKRPAEELYDLRKDPGQLENVAARPEYAAIKERLTSRVDWFMRSTGDPRATGWTDFFDNQPGCGEPMQKPE
jgi:arylsulfatase A-like enzyme